MKPAKTGRAVDFLWNARRPEHLAGAFTETLQKAGLRRGVSNASVFFLEDWDVRVMVHGNVFLALGDAIHLDKLRGEAYKMKCLGILVNEDGDRQESHFLESVDPRR